MNLQQLKQLKSAAEDQLMILDHWGARPESSVTVSTVVFRNAAPMSEPWLPKDDVFTLQAAVEHLRSAAPDEQDLDGKARRADAAFRIAYKLEQIVKRVSNS